MVLTGKKYLVFLLHSSNVWVYDCRSNGLTTGEVVACLGQEEKKSELGQRYTNLCHCTLNYNTNWLSEEN